MSHPLNARSGARLKPEIIEGDPIFSRLRQEADESARREPDLAGYLFAAILSHDRLETALAERLGARLEHRDLPAGLIARVALEAMACDPAIMEGARADLLAVVDRDAACARLIEPVLYFKGYHALQIHRVAHWLLRQGRKDFALLLQSRSSSVFQVDINPAARIGKGVFLDHGTGIVVGETCVIDDNVSLLQGVTLGGTGKEVGDRHPKIRRGVLVGAGAKVLGNIEIGACARIAAGSVVLVPVPPKVTVAGVPAKVVGAAGCAEPARTMDQLLAEKLESDA